MTNRLFEHKRLFYEEARIIPMLISVVVPPHGLNSSSLGSMQTWDNYATTLSPRFPTGVSVISHEAHACCTWGCAPSCFAAHAGRFPSSELSSGLENMQDFPKQRHPSRPDPPCPLPSKRWAKPSLQQHQGNVSSTICNFAFHSVA